jgi:DNA repair exonuclease SbcCD ATPase subunit
VDIAHEAIMRNWSRLAQWIQDEHGQARLYQRLVEDHASWMAAQSKSKALLDGVRLDEAVQWQKGGPTERWSFRYGGDFQTVIGFIESSRRHRRVLGIAATVGLVVVLGSLVWGIAAEINRAQTHKAHDATLRELDALNQKWIAEKEREKAEREKTQAERETAQAERETAQAERERAQAEREKAEAIAAKLDLQTKEQDALLEKVKALEAAAAARAGERAAIAKLNAEIRDKDRQLNDQADTLRSQLSELQQLRNETRDLAAKIAAANYKLSQRDATQTELTRANADLSARLRSTERDLAARNRELSNLTARLRALERAAEE